MSDFHERTRKALERNSVNTTKWHDKTSEAHGKVLSMTDQRIDPAPRPIERRFYHHYKGGLYYVHGIGTHTDTGEELVMYQHVGGKFYARPLADWCKRVGVNRRPPIHRSQMYVERFRLLPEDFKMVP